MRLKKIRLAGFKSFVDPTVIQFPSPLVGIVGPNGCGKSNIIDAVRWVMGETSARHLRGDAMADVIFSGSSARKPVAQASVELVFDNSEGRLGGPYAKYAEISVRRVVSRDGQSQYFLNGTRCRRRDVVDVFLGTGLGPRSYAIIEQGMISQLIEAKPEELRVFVEEAAGISRYKERRRETENRIRHTRENLERLNDLREEVEKQLQKLQRQARTAERFRELRAEADRVAAELLALRLRALERELAQAEARVREAETAVEAALAGQRRIEAELEAQRAAHGEANERLNAIQRRFYETSAEIGRIEQRIQHQRELRARRERELAEARDALEALAADLEAEGRRAEAARAAIAAREPEIEAARAEAAAAAEARAEAEAALQDWQGRWEAFRAEEAEVTRAAEVEATRIEHLTRHLEGLASRRERLSGELEGARAAATAAEEAARLEGVAARLEAEAKAAEARLAQAESGIEAQRERIHELGRALASVRDRMHDRRGRLASLTALQQAALGERGGAVAEWLARHGQAEARRLAHALDVAPGWERAVETVLGDVLEAVCLDDPAALLGSLADLEEGTLTLVAAEEGPAADAAGASDPPPLAAHARGPAAALAFLAGVRAADSLEAALAARARLGPGESVVTRDGIWIGPGWIRVARGEEGKAGVLAREREIAELERRLREDEQEAARLEAEAAEARERLTELEAERGRLQGEVTELHRAHADAAARREAARSRGEEAAARVERLAAELEELEAQVARDRAELEAARARRERLAVEAERLAARRAALEAERERVTETAEAARARDQAARARLHELELALGSERAALDEARRNLERLEAQRGQLRARCEALAAQVAEDATPLEGMQAELEALLQQRAGVEGELAAAREDVEALEQRLRGLEQSRNGAERRVEAAREGLQEVRVRAEGALVRRDTVRDQLQAGGHEPATLLEGLPEEATPEAWEARLAELEGRIERLGPINLAAIEEHREQLERKRYLDAQHADVTQALETLEKAIRKIDRETRARFKETFDRVNAHFQRLFPRLFGGGQAHLELTDDDLLSAGVRVMARPPGKRISTIHLLSGGEKALTAVALVFAFFQLNPAPFCMLDEVDAPLDDANVGRFCELVREMSEKVQFVIITHNKVTMELANQLTGVTMHEPGVSRLVAVDVDEAVRLAAS